MSDLNDDANYKSGLSDSHQPQLLAEAALPCSAAAGLQPGAADPHTVVGVEPLVAVLHQQCAGAVAQAGNVQDRSKGAAGHNSDQPTSSTAELPTRTEAENVG